MIVICCLLLWVLFQWNVSTGVWFIMAWPPEPSSLRYSNFELTFSIRPSIPQLGVPSGGNPRGLLKNPWKSPKLMEVWVGNSMKIIELNGGLSIVMFDYRRVPLLEMMEHEPQMVWLLGWFMIGFTAFGGFKCRFYIMYEAFPMAYTTSPKWGLYSQYNYLIRPTWLQTKPGFCWGYTNIGGRAYTLL